MQRFINYLLEFGHLTEEDKAFVCEKVKVVELNKNEYFSRRNQVTNQLGFSLEGVLRTCYYNENDDLVTKYFVCPSEFAIDLLSYSTQVPSKECIMTVTDCKLAVLTRSDLYEIASVVPTWNAIIKAVTAKGMMVKVNRLSPMVTDDAKTKYNKFLESYPGLANQIPLSLIASYLGITSSSLSRIRRAI